MKNLLKNKDSSAILVTSEINRRYLTNFLSSAGMLLITPDNNYFLTDFRYISDAKRVVKNCEIIEVTSDKGYYFHLKNLLSGIKNLGIEYSSTNVNDWISLKDNFDVSFFDISSDIMNLRQVKTADEILKMQHSQDILDRVFLDILDFIKPGITEKQISAKLISKMYEYGAEGLSFSPIVASGKNGAMPHAKPSDKKIEVCEFITMDFGCVLSGYCSDMTRTIAVGSASDEMRKVYDLVLSAQKLGIDFAKANVEGYLIDKVARDFLNEHGYGQYFGHGFSHGIGLEVHEGISASKSSKLAFPENSVISAEPGIYIDGEFGVRIEDVLILKNDGNINITNSTKSLIIL